MGAYPKVCVRVSSEREEHMNKTKTAAAQTEKTEAGAFKKEKKDLGLMGQWIDEHYERPEDILG